MSTADIVAGGGWDRVIPETNACFFSTAGVIWAASSALAGNFCAPFEAAQSVFFSINGARHEGQVEPGMSLWIENHAVMSAVRKRNLARLAEIEALPHDWNGNGASPFSSVLMAFAKDLVMHLRIQPQIFPTARDSIQLEYENDQGDYLELELFEPDRIKLFTCDHTGQYETRDIPRTSVNEEVSAFYGQHI